jgi:hypothetical protein
MRSMGNSHVEIKFTAPMELQQKIETLKGRLAHKHPSLMMAELLDQLCDLAIDTWNPAAPPKTLLKIGAKGSAVPICATATSRKPCVKSQQQVYRDVFAKAGQCCEKCRSTYALQIDHIYPKAWGGTNEPDNLRILCRNCNQRSALRGTTKFYRTSCQVSCTCVPMALLFQIFNLAKYPIWSER